MKKLAMMNVLLVLTVFGVNAASTPQIINCGIDPVTIQPGQNFTIYADAIDEDGMSDLETVGIFYNSEFVMTLPKSDQPGHFSVTFTMPMDAPEGTIVLGAAVMDRSFALSTIVRFAASIKGSPGITLISPEDGADISCDEPTIFSWQPYTGEFQAYAFAFYMTDGTELMFPLPPFLNELTLPNQVWKFLPDGVYYWKVGVLTDWQQDPSAWSELRSFSVECSDPEPHHVIGRVFATDLELRTISVASEWHHGPQIMTVQVTEQTLILRADGQVLTLEDIVQGDFVSCFGSFADNVFVAERIFVESMPEHHDQVAGTIISIDQEYQAITIQPCEQQGNDAVVIFVTEDTVILDDKGQQLAFADLQIDMRALAVGRWIEGNFTAQEIFVRTGEHEHGEFVHGEIVEIDAASQMIYLASHENPDSEHRPVQITEDTLLHGENGMMTFDQIAIGMWVEGHGFINEAGIMTATELFFRSEHGPDPFEHIDGMVQEIDVTMQILYVGHNQPDDQSIPVVVTEETELSGMNGETITFDQIQIGMMLHAIGQFQEDGSFLAARIIVQTETPPEPGHDQVGGVIQELIPNTMQFILAVHFLGEGHPMVTVQVGENAMITDEAGHLLTFDDLHPNDSVHCTGQWTGDLFIASQIIVHSM